MSRCEKFVASAHAFVITVFEKLEMRNLKKFTFDENRNIFVDFAQTFMKNQKKLRAMKLKFFASSKNSATSKM